MDEDKKHLKLLAVFHYIVAGVTVLFFCFPLIHIAIGIAMLSGALNGDDPGNAPPRFVGWIFIIFPSILILSGWVLSICIIVAGRKLARLKNRLYCLVIAVIECTFIPFGTILGVFTIIVLMRDSVKELFAANNSLTATIPNDI